MTENNTQETKRSSLTLGQKIYLVALTAFVGWTGYNVYQKPLIYLRPHVEQTVERTVRGVDTLREEYKRFDKIFPSTRISAVYVNQYADGQPNLTIYVSEKLSRTNFYEDKGNDGTVDVASVEGNIFYREEKKDLFRTTIDSKFSELKQRLNADQVIAEKLKEAAPTIEDLLNK